MGISVSIAELVPLMKEIFKLGKTFTLTAKGSSMVPLLHDSRDEIILADCVDPSKLKVRDIPLYLRDDGSYVLHRIVRVNKDSFDMCGDAQTEIERGVPKGNVVAIAVGFVRKGKAISVKSKRYRIFGFLWCLARPIRPVLFWLNSKLRGKRNEKPQKQQP